MKTSNKILIGTGLLFVTVIFILMIVGRIMIGTGLEHNEEFDHFENSITKRLEFESFKEIEIKDNWCVTIRQGDKYAIEVSAPESSLENTQVKVIGDRLIFENKNRSNFHRGHLEAIVTMPAIEIITVEDAAKIDLEDFTCDELKIIVKGACKIRGYGNKIANLFLKCEGVSRIDLVDSSVKNAELNVDGTCSIELNMDGGNLVGTASGAAKIVYYGEVNTEKIKTSGVVSVRHRD